MTRTIEVEVDYSKKYPVVVGSNLWEQLLHFCSQNYPARKAVVVIDSRVNALHGAEILSACSQYFGQCTLVEVPEGEQSKSVAEWSLLVDRLLRLGLERSTPLLAVGGGVTGDLAGFAASTVLRGIPLIHMPTTLLSMVDSSIGGKTGVNHKSGKNLIGTFYQPDAVFADIQFLETLAEREWINGLAEVIKYAAIRDPGLFERVEKLVNFGFVPGAEWAELVADSAQIKIDIVQEDVLEAGKRAFLNFGHTFGHALEKSAGYGTISHGEAVFVGMLAACYASQKTDAKQLECTRFEPFMPLYHIELEESVTDIDRLVQLMARDKKVQHEVIRLVLLEDWGRPVLKSCEDAELLKNAWNFALETIRKV